MTNPSSPVSNAVPNAIRDAVHAANAVQRVNAAAASITRLRVGATLATDDASNVRALGGVGADGLQRVASLLAQLESVVANAAGASAANTDEQRAAQSKIDDILRSIDVAANTQGSDAPLTPTTQPNFTVTNVSDFVSNLRVTGAKAPPGTTQDVSLVVTQSAQQGALVLDFGGGFLNLAGQSDDPTASFIIEIGGAGGAVELNFTSGVTVGTMAATINTFTDVTGTKASVIGGRIWLESQELGADEFVSVRVIDDGGASGAGVMTTNSDNVFGVGGAGSHTVAFAKAANIIDHGQNMNGIINGVSVTSDGEFLQFQTAALSFTATLSRTLAQTKSHAHLFTLTGQAQENSAAADPSGRSGEVVNAFEALRALRAQLLTSPDGASPHVAGANARNALDLLG